MTIRQGNHPGPRTWITPAEATQKKVCFVELRHSSGCVDEKKCVWPFCGRNGCDREHGHVMDLTGFLMYKAYLKVGMARSDYGKRVVNNGTGDTGM